MKTILMNAIKTGKATSLFARVSNRSLALEIAAAQTYKTDVMLGDDEYYWVPASHRIQGYLEQMGYEKA